MLSTFKGVMSRISPVKTTGQQEVQSVEQGVQSERSIFQQGLNYAKRKKNNLIAYAGQKEKNLKNLKNYAIQTGSKLIADAGQQGKILKNRFYSMSKRSNPQLLKSNKEVEQVNPSQKLVNNRNNATKFNNYIETHSPYEILNNIILATDSYKLTHWKMYETLGITHVYSYLEARSGAHFSHTVWFGLQYFLEKLEGPIITPEFVQASKAFVEANVGKGYFNEDMWKEIAKKKEDGGCGGYLPVIIRAAPEGSVIKKGNVLLTIENQKPQFVGLVNHLESLLLQVWYPSTVATLSKAVKDAINASKMKIGELDQELSGMLPPLMWTDNQLLDFGYRGASSIETAALGGLAHLTNFQGSDTIAASLLGAKIYGMNALQEIEKGGSYSVPATEHSIMTSLGKESERKLLRALIREHPGGVLSLVMDSYNIFDAIDFICNDEEIVNLILKMEKDSRGIPGKVVFRPDSGSPSEVIPIILGIIQRSLLGQSSKNDIPIIQFFEKQKNGNGNATDKYYYFTSCIGILWGDGMELNTITKLLDDLTTGFKGERVVKSHENKLEFSNELAGHDNESKHFKNNYISERTDGNTSNTTFNKKNISYGSATINGRKYPRTLVNWSPSILLFGMGGGLLQKVSRDTQDFAFKCSANKTKLPLTNNSTKNNITVLSNSRPNTNRSNNTNSERNENTVKRHWVGVIKDPITGSGKKSKKGLLKLVKTFKNNNKRKETVDYETLESIQHKDAFGNINEGNALEVVFKNGVIKKTYDFDEIKENIKSHNVSITAK
jgi:nicotinamide phosphoribosyltransferase